MNSCILWLWYILYPSSDGRFDFKIINLFAVNVRNRSVYGYLSSVYGIHCFVWFGSIVAHFYVFMKFKLLHFNIYNRTVMDTLVIYNMFNIVYDTTLLIITENVIYTLCQI